MKIPLCFALVGWCALTAHADLSYTQTTAMSFGGMVGAPGGTVTKMWLKGGMTRIEMAAMGNKTILLTQANGTTTQINPAAKTYCVMSSTPQRPKGMPAGMGPSEVTISVKKLGVDTIRGVKAPHWRVNMLTKMKTPRGAQTMNMGTEVWSSTTPYPRKAGAATLKQMPGNFMGMMGSNVKIKGDTKSMGAAYATVPLRMKILMNGQTFGTTETTNISTKPLSAALFSVPAGYRKISQAQWEAAQRDAMMKKMSGMMKGMPGRPR